MREILTQSTSSPVIDRERLWSGVRARQALRARRRNILQRSLLGLGAAVTALTVWFVSRTTAIPRTLEGPVAVAGDSLEPSGTEPMIAQQETPTALIPLLGHRTQLRMDIQHLTVQRRELTQQLAGNRLSPPERELLERELAEVNQQLESANTAVAVIDRQLSGQSGVAVAAPQAEHVTTHVEVPMPPVEVPVFVGVQQMVPWIAGGGALLALMMMATLVWVRRVTRATLRELSSLRTQSGTQLTALSEGIEAIALEVERIGEGQRYLSKMIATPNVAEPKVGG
jgi:hypothetical protein